MKTKFTGHLVKLFIFILIVSMLLNGFAFAGDGIILQNSAASFSLKAPVIKLQVQEPTEKVIPQDKPPAPTPQPYEVDGSASAWAVPEIKQAYEYGLTYPGIMYNFQKPITREEFCTIIVILYEKLSKKTAPSAGSAFTDTNNREINKAYQLGIVKGTGEGKFSPNLEITRQEISVMIFRTMEAALPGLDKDSRTSFDFVDRSQIASWALQAMMFAYKHGIVKGTGENRISPLMNTTREQAIALLKRTFEKFADSVGKDLEISKLKDKTSGLGEIGVTQTPSDKNAGIYRDLTGPDGSTPVAVGSKYAANKGISKISAELNAMLTASIPEGVVYVPGINKSVQHSRGTMMVGSSTLSKAPTEEEKAAMTNRVNKLAYPDYDTRLSLTVATGESKQSSRSAGDRAALVHQDGEKKRWFSFSLQNVTGAASVVWQVSTSQFDGHKNNWKNPVGLVKSGQVSAQAGEFQVDFAAFAPAKTNSNGYRIDPGGVLAWGGDKVYREIPTPQKVYYVRAVPVDTAGNCIGDPGPGIAVLYGIPITEPGVRSLTVSPSFEVWCAQQHSEPFSGGEFPNLFEHKTSLHISCDESSPYWFQLKGFDTAAVQLVVQVSTRPFTGGIGNWEAPEDLAYSMAYKTPLKLLGNEFPNAVPVDFSSFSPERTIFKPGEAIKYYLRAVALYPSSGAGSLVVAFSETIPIAYGKQNPVQWMQEATHTVKSYIPDIKILHYEPIKREDPDWEHYYTVYREPTTVEIKCKYQNMDTGVILYPYYVYQMHFSSLGLDRAPTPQEYETQIIPQVLKVGSRVVIFPREENKSWWEELWDAIVEFFENIVDLVAKVVNWASNAYANLKSAIITFIASTIPLPGPLAGLRDELELALEALANAGLMALGLPPTLPNFDKLCKEGLGYLAEVALTEAGIPSNELTNQLLTDTVSAIGSEIEKSYAQEGPNPLEAPFLKHDTDYMEQPAYLDIELYNPYDKPSLPGSFNISVTWPYTENITAPGFIASDKQAGFLTHFLFGLKRGAGYYYTDYPLFKPASCKIPVLKPGQRSKARIYLEPYIGMPYPFAPQGDAVTETDFRAMYFGHLGKVHFNVSTNTYDLPDPKAVAAEQGFVPQSGKIYTYRYDKQRSSDSFIQKANVPYNR